MPIGIGPSTWTNQAGATCGRPSPRTVANHTLRSSCRGSGALTTRGCGRPSADVGHSSGTARHYVVRVPLRFEPVRWPEDADAVVAFLAGHTWPFHGVARLTPEAAAEVTVASDDVASIWICDEHGTIGLIRLLELSDLEDGSPLFDLRIAEPHRGRGVGNQAVEWLTGHLFGTHRDLHRIEATTRDDNMSMQAVFDRCGWRLEGRFVEAWRNADGSRRDALTYAILRREHDR